MTRDRYATVLLDVEPGTLHAPARHVPDRAFNILVTGDLTGTRPPGEPASALHTRRPMLVDRDTVDDVLGRVRPAVRFQLGGTGPFLDITFSDLDDFHPDRLIERVPLLSSLAVLREEARAGRAALGPVAASGPVDSSAGAPARPAAGRSGSLLDQIVEDVSGPAPVASSRREPPPASDLHAYISSVLAPHMVPEADPHQTALVAQIEDTMVSVLRAILHHPDVQALESIWRGVSLLVRGLETGPRLRVFVFDASRAELEADLASDDAVETSALLKLFAAGAGDAAGAEPWALIAGHYTFGDSPADAALLARIAALARHVDAPFIAAAAPSLAGLSSFAAEPEAGDVHASSAPEWVALRRSALATGAGLALPRFLLRAPYDPREEPCESVPLEEMSSPPAHDDYLWGSPAVACALLLGRAFGVSGWEMRPHEQDLELDGLPLHLYRVDGETRAKPCAEALLTDRAASRILDAGLMPLLSMKNGDTVRLAGFQSIAEPSAELAGGWSAGG